MELTTTPAFRTSNKIIFFELLVFRGSFSLKIHLEKHFFKLSSWRWGRNLARFEDVGDGAMVESLGAN